MQLSDLDPPRRGDADRARSPARSAAAAATDASPSRRTAGWHGHRLHLRGRGRRQGRGGRRPAARRRGAGHHRTVLRRAGPQGRRRAAARTARLLARLLREAPMKPARVRLRLRAETVDEVTRRPARARQRRAHLAGGQSLCRCSTCALPAALCWSTSCASRRCADRRSETDALVVPAAVRAGGANGALRLAHEVPLLAAACPGSAICRPGRAAPSAARSPMPTRAPRCRSAWSRSAARSAARATQAPARPPPSFFTGMMVTDRADDELIEAVAFLRRTRQRLRVREVGAPARRLRHRRLRGGGRRGRACGSRSPASPTGRRARDLAAPRGRRARRCAQRLRLGARCAATTSTPRRAIGATSCASSVANVSRRPLHAALERRPPPSRCASR